DQDLLRRGASMTVEFMVEIGAVPFYLSIVEGRLVSLERGPALMRSWRFAIRGTVEAWTRFWQPVPEPGWHDIFALTKRQEARVEGDLRPFMTHLQYIKDLLAVPRRVFKEG
ncbi:MAG: hypothetical protein V1751_00680, partial [Pseudomonadota bacterium]